MRYNKFREAFKSYKEIEAYYPENLRPFKRSLMREYIQYKILEIIFGSNQAEKLSFLGGTAIRMLHLQISN